MNKLSRSFYENPDVTAVARSLIGKRLVTHFDGTRTGGIITETEAYAGTTDRASHAYNGRRTERTQVMYMRGGTAYVYLCYGMHALFNVVTNTEGVPHAILVRAIEPDTGIPTMKRRRNLNKLTPPLTSGPGNLSKALGISTVHTGTSLTGRSIWIEDVGSSPRIETARRVGIDYAGADARKPWRFLLANSRWVTHPNRR